MRNISSKIRAMFDGLGLDPQDVIHLADKNVGQDDLYRITSPFASLGRYRKYIAFMDDITSLKALYKYRVMVVVEYFIALAEAMERYEGKYRDNKIIPRPLTAAMKEALRSIGPNLTPQQIAQIELIETKSDHDTAAITDWVKFVVDQQNILGFAEAEVNEKSPLTPLCQRGGMVGSLIKGEEEWINSLDGFHFGRTSEDVNSPVFALMNRELFFKHVIPEIIAFQEAIIKYAREHDRATAGLTHGQPAEPTTIGKQLMNTVSAIDSILRQVFLPCSGVTEFKSLRVQGSIEPLNPGTLNLTGKPRTISFPVKTFGAVGNHSDLRAAYPDIDWIENDWRFVAALGPGLHLDMMATQASLYGEYKLIYDAVCTIARHILKFTRDFWGWTSFQWFKKKKREGVKGSSVMPNKYNPWRMEGASRILEKFIVQLEYTAKALMDYPYEGDMGRSIVMRDIGDDFAKFFIALGRIREELQLYEVNSDKVEEFLRNNPGLVGGAAQTILKRARVPGDAYRHIQQIMINPDGSYVSQEEFERRLHEEMARGIIPPEVVKEILQLADPKNNTGYARELTLSAIERAEETIRMLRQTYK